MQLSHNFTLEELIESTTAIQSGITNVPITAQVECLKDLCVNLLQPIRDYFNLPITIRSGFRSSSLNHAVGGAPDSQHMRGQAADITIHGIGNDVIWQYIVDNMIFDQVILEHCPAKATQRGWVHVSFKAGANRKDALSCPSLGHYIEGLAYAA